jgi:hypothetical protein
MAGLVMCTPVTKLGGQNTFGTIGATGTRGFVLVLGVIRIRVIAGAVNAVETSVHASLLVACVVVCAPMAKVRGCCAFKAVVVGFAGVVCHVLAMKRPFNVCS